MLPASVAHAWLGIAVLAGCASAPPEPACDLRGLVPGEAEVAIPYGEGVLWRVEREGTSPSHVFGTMHAKGPEITRLPGPVAARFAAAESVGVEVIPTPAAVQALESAIELPGGDLELLIGPERMRRVEEAGARYGAPERRLRRMKPWALALLFAIPPREVRDRRPPLDQVLVNSAAARDVPVFGLESMEEQIESFDGLDLDSQIAMLDQALAENSRIECWWQQVLEPLYLTRDTGTLYALLAPRRTDDEEVWGALIRDRNVRMVERMQSRLLDGGTFVAVGAAHLPGDSGVLDLLAEQGYRISAIY